MAAFRTSIPRACCACLCVVAGLGAVAAAPPASPRFALAYWEAMPGPMALPVFDAMVADVRGHVVVAGGFTRDLEATQAIQIRHPLYGWLPIGTALSDPRGRATITPLPDDRFLILGGYRGTWGRDARPLADGETLDLLLAGSNRPVDAWSEPLEGHTATPLPDGRVAVVSGCELRFFDPTFDGWSEPVHLSTERRHHAAILVGRTLVLIGGDEAGTIESFDLREDPPTSTLWQVVDLPPLRDAAAIALDGRMGFIAGGFDESARRTTARTWIIDVARRAIDDGPALPLERGAGSLALALHPRGVLVLDGEWRRDGDDGESRGNANAAFLVDPRRGARAVAWSLPALDGPLDLSRRMLLRHEDGTIEAIGGYRFRSPIGARPGEEIGVVVDGSGQRLVVDAQGTAD
jgi:hypothetical protein